MMKATVIGSFAALFMVACAAEDASFPGGGSGRGPNGSGDVDGNGDGTGDGTGPGQPGDPTQPGSCAEGVAHVGLGGQNFVADRQPGAIGADRRRVKPFSALTTEYRRVIGATPASLTSAGAAFGDIPPRWFQETRANAVGLYTTYATAFTACYDSMGDAKYGAAPTAQTAEAECGALQRKAWLRTPTTEELGVCRDLAVTGLATEANARRRWSHVCASVMTSAGFTSF